MNCLASFERSAGKRRTVLAETGVGGPRRRIEGDERARAVIGIERTAGGRLREGLLRNQDRQGQEEEHTRRGGARRGPAEWCQPSLPDRIQLRRERKIGSAHRPIPLRPVWRPPRRLASESVPRANRDIKSAGPCLPNNSMADIGRA